MMRLVTWICVLAAGTVCVLAMSAKQGGKTVHRTDALTVFLTGNELGTLRPCGCSGGQLGGFSRRSAILNSVPPSNRLVVDTGLFLEQTGEQDIIKYNIIIQALNLLDYDLVNLTGEDIKIAKKLGVLDGIKSVLNLITSHGSPDVNVPAAFTKKISLNARPVAVTVAAFDANSSPVGEISKLFKHKAPLQTVNILILNRCDPNVVTAIAKKTPVDCLVCPAESDEPMVVGDPNKSPLIISVGRYGKYVARLQIKPDGPKNGLKLSFSAIAVTENLPQQNALIDLYKSYQHFVKDANLLGKQPRWSLPDGLKYTGSESCRLCHSYEYKKWSAQKHAHAYAALQKVGSQFDPECVRCHVVGMQYETGFVSEQKTPHLENVGCENCHGPGSEHIENGGEIEISGPRSVCADCHTPEHSGEYEGKKKYYFRKIIHWREPNTPADVKSNGDTED